MGYRKRREELGAELDGRRLVEPPDLFEERFERFATQKLEHGVRTTVFGNAAIETLHDVRASEPRENLRFDPHALEEAIVCQVLGLEDLDRDGDVERHVVRLENITNRSLGVDPRHFELFAQSWKHGRWVGRCGR
jgi:hypothetical protein